MTRDSSTGRNMCRTPDELAERFAGYESEDVRIWGSQVLRGLRLWWLPQLDGHSLAVPAESLAAFREECVMALNVTGSLAVESGCKERDIRQVLQNFLRSTGEAESAGGWVEIG